MMRIAVGVFSAKLPSREYTVTGSSGFVFENDKIVLDPDVEAAYEWGGG